MHNARPIIHNARAMSCYISCCITTANNCSVLREVLVEAPDLVVSEFTANPPTISSGQTVSLSAIVTNSGNRAANETHFTIL